MSPNRRIVLNIAATYGRSLYQLAIGLFCGRWTLMALGVTDFGLMSVVGGLTAFIAFFNTLLANAVGRFYACSIGKAGAGADKDAALEECREWFSVAVCIHTVVPCLLMAAGYPIGEWAVRHFLMIPPERLESCVWVFRFVCISSFLSMVSVPFNAMYTAKQYIAELTVYSFVTATLNIFVLHYMVTHPGIWLVAFAAWTCVLNAVPKVLIAARAVSLFPECRFRYRYARNAGKIRQIVDYAGWTTVGGIATILRNQGLAVLVNRFFGPSVNAAMGIAGNVNAQTATLSNSIHGAMTPVVSQAVGAGDMEKVRRLSFRFCKLSMSAALVFMVPLAVELPLVMRMWLKNPPPYSVGLCWMMLLQSFLDKNTLGHGMAVMSYGRLKWYQIVVGGFNMLTLPAAWVFCRMGMNVYWVGVAMVSAWSLMVYSRLFFARKYLNMGMRKWASEVMLPVLASLAVAAAAAALPKAFMPATPFRAAAAAILSTAVLAPMIWFFVADGDERDFLKSKLCRKFGNG